MLSFVALPAFLMVLSLARFGFLVWSPVSPVNSPGSSARWWHVPRDVDLETLDDRPGSALRGLFAKGTADLTLGAAQRAESGAPFDRVEGLRDLAWWTAVCPDYAPFTLARLVQALRDPNPRIKAAAAIGLGSTGGHGAPALPDLLAARGTSVAYFDHIVAEAVFLIEGSPRWGPARGCEDMAVDELERRAAHSNPEAVPLASAPEP
jgi:hypothetical protein